MLYWVGLECSTLAVISVFLISLPCYSVPTFLTFSIVQYVSLLAYPLASPTARVLTFYISIISQTMLIYHKFLCCFPLYRQSTCNSLGGPASAQTSSHGMTGQHLANPPKAAGTDLLFVAWFIDSWLMCLHWWNEDPGTHVLQELQVTVPFPAPPDPLAGTLDAQVSLPLTLMFSLSPHPKLSTPPCLLSSGSGMLAINYTGMKKIMARILHRLTSLSKSPPNVFWKQ